MPKDNVLPLSHPGAFTDLLTEVLRNGAQALLAQAVEAQAADFLAKYSGFKTEAAVSARFAMAIFLERTVMTGIGVVPVRQPRLRDRAVGADDSDVKFTPTILPPYARRSKSLDALLPILYLKGVSTGDFGEALAALLGKDAPGLSASTIARLKDVSAEERKAWEKRDLSTKRYVHVWADGIHLQARLEDGAQCILVLIGATPEGKKELVGFTDGLRESAESWRGLLLHLQGRGLKHAPKLAIGDGALGFWKALGEVWPKTLDQRCWVHKTANVLNKLPKSLHAKVKRELQDIWMAPSKAIATGALDLFKRTYGL